MSLHKLLGCWALAGAIVGCAGSDGAGDANTCRNLDNGIPLCGPSSVQVPLEPGSTSPVILARIDGRTIRVLIDTGAQAPIISSTWLGVADAQWIRTHELCFGELCLRGEQVYAQDTEFSLADAAAINGFIGMRTLKHFIVQFEHANSVRFSQGASACTGTSHPLTFSELGIPQADVSADGHAFPGITIDSGSTYTLLSPTSLAQLDPYVSAQGQVADLCTVDGCMTGVASTSTVNEYCVFGSCRMNVPVKFPVFDAVGSSFLFLGDTAFDFPQSRLVFCE
jgi:hypothetical protein